MKEKIVYNSKPPIDVDNGNKSKKVSVSKETNMGRPTNKIVNVSKIIENLLLNDTKIDIDSVDGSNNSA